MNSIIKKYPIAFSVGVIIFSICLGYGLGFLPVLPSLLNIIILVSSVPVASFIMTYFKGSMWYGVVSVLLFVCISAFMIFIYTFIAHNVLGKPIDMPPSQYGFAVFFSSFLPPYVFVLTIPALLGELLGKYQFSQKIKRENLALFRDHK